MQQGEPAGRDDTYYFVDLKSSVGSEGAHPLITYDAPLYQHCSVAGR